MCGNGGALTTAAQSSPAGPEVLARSAARAPGCPRSTGYAVIPVARNVWHHVEGGKPRRRGAPLDHRQHEPPLERPARQPPPRRVHALEERDLRLLEPARLAI